MRIKKVHTHEALSDCMVSQMYFAFKVFRIHTLVSWAESFNLHSENGAIHIETLGTFGLRSSRRVGTPFEPAPVQSHVQVDLLCPPADCASGVCS